MRTLIIVLAASVIAAPSFAADTGKSSEPAPAADKAKPDPSTAQAQAKPEPEKLICTKEATVGSNIVRKVCRTQAQVDADRAGARRLSDQRSSLQNGFGAPTP